ncbi:MAG TPA: sigma-70 family RNA polymerase sigma factor [Rhodopila sp.]
MMHIDQRLRLFLRYQAALIDLAAPIVGCRASAEDIVQEAYLRFLAVGPDRPEILRPVPYLYQIVRRLSFDWVRSHSRERPGVLDNEFLEQAASPAPSPEHTALYRQELALIVDALGELPERTRIAFEMHRLGGYKLQDIAKELGISVTLAHQLIHRALAHCAARLAID